MKDELINLNSLTDIVSNSVGILVLLSLLTLFQAEKKVFEVDIPIEHQSNQCPVFFICKDDALLFLDSAIIFQNAIAESERGLTDENNEFSSGYGELTGKLDDRNRLVIYPQSTSAWDGISGINDGNSEIRKALDKLDPAKYFAFFFVYDEAYQETGSGFESFRKAREYLKGRNIKSGWMPADDDHPPYICFWGDQPDCEYMPSYRLTGAKASSQ